MGEGFTELHFTITEKNYIVLDVSIQIHILKHKTVFQYREYSNGYLLLYIPNFQFTMRKET